LERKADSQSLDLSVDNPGVTAVKAVERFVSDLHLRGSRFQFTIRARLDGKNVTGPIILSQRLRSIIPPAGSYIVGPLNSTRETQRERERERERERKTRGRGEKHGGATYGGDIGGGGILTTK
jgi:hypothetical protein